MTWQEGMAALQLIAEEGIGRAMRDASRLENAREDASRAALRAEQAV